MNVTTNATGLPNTGDSRYLDVKQRMEFIPEAWMDGKTVKCKADILDTQGNSLIYNKKETNVTFTVEAPPVPSNETEIIPEGQFVEEEEGLVVIYFHSNPKPE